MTAIAEAFAKNGLEPRDVEFDIAIAKYLNSGGTIAGARDRLNAHAERMSGMGQISSAVTGHSNFAQTRQQVEDGEAVIPSPTAGRIPNALPSSFNRGGEGRSRGAVEGQKAVALPIREPTMQQRMISARNARVVAITIMDTLKVDGRAIGDWTVGEARRAGRLKTREGHILIAASRMVANAAGHELLRSVVKPDEMQKIVQKAAEVADAV